MSRVAAPQGKNMPLTTPRNLEEMTDIDVLREIWQVETDSHERRRIRARMYKLREKCLREMVQNDAESLGALTTTQQGSSSRTSSKSSVSSTRRRSSTTEVNLQSQGQSTTTENVSTENTRKGSITSKTQEATRKRSDALKVLSDEEIIEEQIKEVSEGRTDRYNRILNEYDTKSNMKGDLSGTQSYSVQSSALSGDSYQSMKHKEVRDSVSPTRSSYMRRSANEDSEGRFTSDEETFTKSRVKNSRLASKNAGSVSASDAFTRKSNSKRVNERRLSKDLSSQSDDNSSTTSRKTVVDVSQRNNPAGGSTFTEKTTSPTKKTVQASIKAETVSRNSQRKGTGTDKSVKNEYKKLDSYLTNTDADDEIILEEEEEAEDSSGNVVRTVVQTRRKKDGSEYSARRVARTTKIVDSESDIDEILIGNPDHEVINRNIEEKQEADGSKIKIITEMRRRPDGVEYKTKNVLKTSKIFDYDHPEDITYSDEDDLIDSKESEEMDEQGIVIRTITETRKKPTGVEYTTKKVYKTSKIKAPITPSHDDEILDSQVVNEKQSDGSTVRIVIEKRRTKGGDEYTHRQIFQARKMTLSGIELEDGLPTMTSDDEVLKKTEKMETDERGANIRVVTETRKRKDGSTYLFEYVFRNFMGTEKDIERVPVKSKEDSSIAVSAEDKLLKEDIKEVVQTDGSTVKTIIERRKAKDGTEYLRHRILRIPKLPEPELQVASLEDEVLEEDINEDILEDGSQCRAITERRKSSVTGLQYTLRRMSRVFQPSSHLYGVDEIIDENTTEEETLDGVLIKTVIRRYQRADDSVYTTHDVSRTYKNPVSVSVSQSVDDELVDRSFDVRETYDGFIIKTIMETRCRSDGVHYTIERTEKVEKRDHDADLSLTESSIVSGTPGDTVVSSEDHEEPGEAGIIVKTILEVRRRPDGTEYTNKITIKTTQILVPEHETSYVVIKPDPKDGDSGFMPSLDDEILFTRKKKEVDDKGNTINVIIETRLSKTTGEKYNLTKRVTTTDVVVTEDGEKILSKRPSAYKSKLDSPNSAPRGQKSREPVSSLKNKFTAGKTVEKKVTPRKEISGTNTASKKKFFEVAATTPAAPNKGSPKSIVKGSGNLQDRKQKLLATKTKVQQTDTLKRTENARTSTVSKNTTAPQPIKTTSPRKTVSSPVKSTHQRTLNSDKPSSTRSPITKKTDTGEVPKTSSPEKRTKKTDSIKPKSVGLSSTDSDSPLSQNESPKRRPATSANKRLPNETTPQKTVNNRKGRSPTRTKPSPEREVTPSRQCCKRMHNAREPIPKPKTSPEPKKRPVSSNVRDTKKVTDDESPQKDLTPRRPKSLSLKNKSDQSSMSSDSSRTPSPTKSPTKKSVAPLGSTASKSTPGKIRKLSPPDVTKPEIIKQARSPIVSLPQTPMPSEETVYPVHPMIEDVTSDPNLPYHPIHRPSIVSEAPDQRDDIESKYPRKNSQDKPCVISTKLLDSKRTVDVKEEEKRFSSSDEEKTKKQKSSFTSTPVNSTRNKPLDYSSPKSSSDRPVGLSRLRNIKKDETPLFTRIAPEQKPSEKLDSSILSQIIPTGTDTGYGDVDDLYYTKEKTSESEVKSSLSAKKSLFESVTDKKSTSVLTSEERVPVKEPIVKRKYIHPLGSDDEESPDISKQKLSDKDLGLTSTRLVLKTMSPEPRASKEGPSFPDEVSDVVSPLKNRSPSPFSKESSPRPRSKEGSPAPFAKEASPGRFVTGKPIDQGPNSNKIKRLERAGSNKMLYEDLEVQKDELRPMLQRVESISEVEELEILLEKAETYEERRIIRGRIRILKRPSGTQPASVPLYKRFVDTTASSKMSPSSSPQLSRRFNSSTVEPQKQRPTESAPSRTFDVKTFDNKREVKVPTPSEKPARKISPTPLQQKKVTEKVQEKLSEDKVSKKASEVVESSQNVVRQQRKVSNEFETRKRSFESRRTSSSTVVESKKESSDSETKSYARKTSRQTDDSQSEQEDTASTKRRNAPEPIQKKQPIGKEKKVETTAPSTPRIVKTVEKRQFDREPLNSSTKNRDKSSAPKSVTDVCAEPLRHQRTQNRSVKQTQQTHVETIMSPYGVGPTDDNGLPLFGLKALKRRNKPEEDVLTPVQREKSPEKTTSSLFGIKATQNTTLKPDAGSDEKPKVTSEYSRAREMSPALVSSIDKTLKKGTPHATSESETDETTFRGKNLKNLIQMHESKVTEVQTTPETPSASKPRRRLLDTFEPIEVSSNKPHRTWDLESDLVTRSDEVENIIARHETLTQQDAPTKRLTGILKKTSTSSLTASKTDKIESETQSSSDETTERIRRKYSTDSRSSIEANTASRRLTHKTYDSSKESEQTKSVTAITGFPKKSPEAETTKPTIDKLSTKKDDYKSESVSERTARRTSQPNTSQPLVKRRPSPGHEDGTAPSSKSPKRVPAQQQAPLISPSLLRKTKLEPSVPATKPKSKSTAPSRNSENPNSQPKTDKKTEPNIPEKQSEPKMSASRPKRTDTTIGDAKPLKQETSASKRTAELSESETKYLSSSSESSTRKVKSERKVSVERTQTTRRKSSVHSVSSVDETKVSTASKRAVKKLRYEDSSSEVITESEDERKLKTTSDINGDLKLKRRDTPAFLQEYRDDLLESDEQRSLKSDITKIRPAPITTSRMRGTDDKRPHHQRPHTTTPTEKDKKKISEEPESPRKVNKKDLIEPNKFVSIRESFKKKEQDSKTIHEDIDTKKLRGSIGKKEQSSPENRGPSTQPKTTPRPVEKSPSKSVSASKVTKEKKQEYATTSSSDESRVDKTRTISTKKHKSVNVDSSDIIKKESKATKTPETLTPKDVKFAKSDRTTPVSIVDPNKKLTTTKHDKADKKGKPSDTTGRRPSLPDKQSPEKSTTPVKVSKKPTKPTKTADTPEERPEDKSHPNKTTKDNVPVSSGMSLPAPRDSPDCRAQISSKKLTTEKTVNKTTLSSVDDVEKVVEDTHTVRIKSKQEPVKTHTGDPSNESSSDLDKPDTKPVKESETPTTKDTFVTVDGRPVGAKNTSKSDPDDSVPSPLRDSKNVSTPSQEIHSVAVKSGVDSQNNRSPEKTQKPKPETIDNSKTTTKPVRPSSTTSKPQSKSKDEVTVVNEPRPKATQQGPTLSERRGKFENKAVRDQGITTKNTTAKDIRVLNKTNLKRHQEGLQTVTDRQPDRPRTTPQATPEQSSRHTARMQAQKRRSMSRDSLKEKMVSTIRKKSDATVGSMHSISSASTASSVPSYMRPKGDSRRRSTRMTPERDPEDIENILLNSYQYTRCTKRVQKPPITYDYTYAINPDSKPAGGGPGSYSIYFGPREKSPAKTMARSEHPAGSSNVQQQMSDQSQSRVKNEIDRYNQSRERDIHTVHNEYRNNRNLTEDSRRSFAVDQDTNEQCTSLRRESETPLHNRGETYPEIRQQYLDTVKNIDAQSKESFRRKQSEDLYSHQSINERKDTQGSYTSSHEKNYEQDNIQGREFRSANDSLTRSDHLSVPMATADIPVTSGSVTERNSDGSMVRDHKDDLQQKYKYQVENHLRSYMKTSDDQVRESTPIDVIHSDSNRQDGNSLFSIDFNKVYANRLNKHKDMSTSEMEVASKNERNLQSSSTNQFSSSQSKFSQEFSEQNSSYEKSSANYDTAQSDSFYVTIDGRLVDNTPTKDTTDTTKMESQQQYPGFERVSNPGLTQRNVDSSLTDQTRTQRFDTNNRHSSSITGQSFSSTVEERGSQFSGRQHSSHVTNSSDMRDEKSFLSDNSKVSGIQDVLSRMGATEAVDHESKVTSDEQARSLLNKFLGAQVLMSGVESMMANTSISDNRSTGNVNMSSPMSGQATPSMSRGGQVAAKSAAFTSGTPKTPVSTSSKSQQSEPFVFKGVNINEVQDSFELNELLDSCEEYEARRRIRLRLKEVVAREKAEFDGQLNSSTRKTAGTSRVATVGSSVRSNEGGTTSHVTKTFSSGQSGQSALNKFKQLDSQQPGAKSPRKVCGPLFTLSSSLNRSATSIKDMILNWCQCRTRGYQGVKIENFSTSWNDGMAFCALIHHFFPDAFDFNSLNPKNRRYNFTLAFRVADETAGVFPLLDVEDMVMMQKPDWKCVFTYVQTLYKRLKDE